MKMTTEARPSLKCHPTLQLQHGGTNYYTLEVLVASSGSQLVSIPIRARIKDPSFPLALATTVKGPNE
jgi:hypothetical protein